MDATLKELHKKFLAPAEKLIYHILKESYDDCIFTLPNDILETVDYLLESKLSDVQKNVIKSLLYENLSYKEIGDKLNMSEANVGRVYESALCVLRRKENFVILAEGLSAYRERQDLKVQFNNRYNTKRASMKRESDRLRNTLKSEDIFVYDAGISRDLSHWFLRNGFKTVDSVAECGLDNLMNMRGFGKKKLMETIDMLKKAGKLNE